MMDLTERIIKAYSRVEASISELDAAFPLIVDDFNEILAKEDIDPLDVSLTVNMSRHEFGEILRTVLRGKFIEMEAGVIRAYADLAAVSILLVAWHDEHAMDCNTCRDEIATTQDMVNFRKDMEDLLDILEELNKEGE